MNSLKQLNSILLVFVLLLGLALGAVYASAFWKNQKLISHVVESSELEKFDQPPIAIKDLDAQRATILGQQDNKKAIEYQKGNAAVTVPVNASRDIFVKKEPVAATTPTAQPTEEFTFVAIGDADDYADKSYDQTLVQVLQAAKGLKPDVAFFTGDLTALESPHTAQNKERVWQIKKLIDSYFPKRYLTFGNHDLECGQACIDTWQEVFFNKKFMADEKRILYHSFDYANAHISLLANSYPKQFGIDDEQLAWLEKDLAQTKQTHKIVFLHVPPVTFFEESKRDCHDMSCSGASRDRLVAMLEKYKVDLVVSGHEHAFDHKVVNGIDYVLSGNSSSEQRHEGTFSGNNFSAVTVNGNSIRLRAMDVSGRVLREIVIK